MELDFNTIDKSLSKYKTAYKALIKKTFKILNLSFDPIISVSLVDNEFIHAMNRDYRNIDRPTDVISFAFLDGEDRETFYNSQGPVCLGDIYISIEKAKTQSEEYGHSFERELSFLFVHGLLHLLGYDHMEKEDEKIMFALQTQIIGERNAK